MDQLVEFATNHPYLVAAFFVVLGLLIANLVAARGGLNPQEAVRLINHEQAIIVDLRSRKDFESGHIIDALHIPMAELKGAQARLKKHDDKPILLYCDAGTTSPRAVKEIKQLGLDRVYALRGGINAWRGESLPVSTG